jgi:hyperosmotically inducible periplasmic protein
MTLKWLTTLFVVGALIAPVAGQAADVKESAKNATEKTKEVVQDATITTKIKADFAKDKQVSATRIKVDTDNGVVKLSGTAKSKEEADKAVQIAQSTKGVASVDNQIQISAGTSPSGATTSGTGTSGTTAAPKY